MSTQPGEVAGTSFSDELHSAVTDSPGWENLTVPFSKIPAIPATYLWPGVIPNRTPTFLVAPGGTGKGLAIARIAAITTTGEPFPGQAQGREPGQVITISPEDDANEDMAFRLRAAGANLSLVRDLTLLPDGSPLLLSGNVPELRHAITEANNEGPPVLLVTIDPLDALAENGLSTQRHAREVMNPLLDVARDYDLAMLLSHHTTKNPGVVAGSKVLTDTARLVWMISVADDDPDQRVMTVWKSNRPAGPSMRYLITGEGNKVHAVFSGPDTGPDSLAPSSRAARLRLNESPEAFADRWLDEHPENPPETAETLPLTPAAPEAPETVPVPGMPPEAPSGPPGPVANKVEDAEVVAYLQKYINEGDPDQVKKIAAELLDITKGKTA